MNKETNIEKAERMIQFCIDWMKYENENMNHISYQKAKQELAYWEDALKIAEKNHN